VALHDVGIESAQRQARIRRLEPEGEPADLDRHGVEIHAEAAIAEHLAQRARVVGQGISRRCRAHHVSCQPPGSAEQEVARAAGGVDDGELGQSARRLLRVGRDGVAHDRLERRIEQHLHQAIWRVVAAGAAPHPAGLLVAGSPAELGSVALQRRLQPEQALVGATELLRGELAPAHLGRSGRHGCRLDAASRPPAERAQGARQHAVVNLRGIEPRAALLGKDTAERREREQGFPVRQTAKHCLQPGPDTRAAEGHTRSAWLRGLLLVVARTAQPSLWGAACGMQTVARLGAEQQQAAVDEPEQLAQIAFGRQRLIEHCAAQGAVRRVVEEPLPQHLERGLDAQAPLRQRAFARRS
jgi:hypothetical protein